MSIAYQECKGTDGVVELWEDRVIIRRSGFQAMSRGAEHVIPIFAITEVQLVRPGMISVGTIYFAYVGGPPNRTGSRSSVMFSKAQSVAFEQLHAAVVKATKRRPQIPKRDPNDVTFSANPEIQALQSALTALRRMPNETPMDKAKSQGAFGISGAVFQRLAPGSAEVKGESLAVVKRIESELAGLEAEDRRALAAWQAAAVSRRTQLESVVAAINTSQFDTSEDEEPKFVSTRLGALRHPSFSPTSEGPPALSLAAGEWLAAEYAVHLAGYRDDGYGLTAQMSGSFSGHTSGVSLSGDHFGISAGSMSGRMSAGVDGSLDRREAYEVLDAGRLTITNERVVFIGSRRTDEVWLRDMLGASGTVATLDVKWSQKRDGEVYRVLDGDILAMLLVALKGRLARALASAPAPNITGGVSIAAHVNASEHSTGRVERECPSCAEPILAKAKVCKHCGRDVPATDS